MAVTDWSASGAALLDRSFKRFGAPRLDDTLTFDLLAGQPSSLNIPAVDSLSSDWLRVVRIAGTGTKPFFHGESLHALTVLEGSAVFLDRKRTRVLELHAGDTAAIPARHDDLWLEGARLHAIRASIEP